MDDYPGDVPEAGVTDVSSADLQSTIPDMRMTHPNQLAAWTQAHEDGQYVTFTSGSGSGGVVYDAQVTDIVQQAYLQSALVQSDSSTDKFPVYPGGPTLDKSSIQTEDAINFSRNVETDTRRYDLMRSKGLEIVHTVSLEEVESVYRQVTKSPGSNEPLHLMESSSQPIDATTKDMEKSMMTEYGRVLLKQQQSQYDPHASNIGMRIAPTKQVLLPKDYSSEAAMKTEVALAMEAGEKASRELLEVNLNQEVDLYDQDWREQTRLLLFNLMTEHKLCDAAISTGKFTIKLHKLVLAMSSERFASLLSSGDNTRVANIMVPVHISESTLKVFVTFLYLGKVKVSLELIHEIKMLSKIFEIHNLEHLCYGIMIKHNISTNSGSWPNLKVTFDSIYSKKDQSVGTEECYFKAMSELAKHPQQRKNRGRTKKGPKRKVNPTIADPELKLQPPIKPAKAAPHRYGTRGALLYPEKLDVSGHVEPVTRKRQDQPIVKQGPKARFGRNAAQRIAAKTADGEQELEDSFEAVKPCPAADVLDLAETSHSNGVQEAILETEPNSQTVSFVPETSSIQTLQGRKQKLLQSVEQSKTMEASSDPSIIVTPSPQETLSKKPDGAPVTLAGKADVPEILCTKPAGATFESPLPGASGSLTGDGAGPCHLATDTFTAVKKGKKGRAKKFPPPTHVAVRPPPKKRAKMELNRLNRSNEDEDNAYNLPMIFLSPSPSPVKPETTPVQRITKPKPKKRKRWLKADIISQLSSELERLAEYIEDRERQYKCVLCGNEFVFPKRSVTHLLNTHQVPIDEVILNVVIRKKESSPKVCDICGYKTKDPNFYYIHYHRYFRHGIPLPKGWKPFTCDICGKECFTKFQLKDHKLIHQEETPFVCEVCGTGFKSRTCLNSHMFHKHSDERKHGCPECQKSFKTKTQRLVHMRVHSGEKPFSCPDCPYKSTTRGNMRLHLCNKHKYNTDRIKDIMFQLKTMEMQKILQEPANFIPSAIVQHTADTSGLSDSSMNVSDPSLQTDVPLTLTATSALDRVVNVIAAEHAMHAILLPLGASDNMATGQTITTYAVESSIPLSTMTTDTHVLEPETSSSPLNPQREHATTHFYMQHSPISPPPPSESPQAPYASAANLQQSPSPLNLQAAQVVTTTLTPVSVPQATSPDSTPTYETVNNANQQTYDTAMIQAYYQQQFYPHGYS